MGLLGQVGGVGTSILRERPTRLISARTPWQEPHDPQQLASADRVDLLCAFVKWHGLRTLEKQLASLAERQVPFRVITTTYVGATERAALDRIVGEFGGEVRVNYTTA